MKCDRYDSTRGHPSRSCHGEVEEWIHPGFGFAIPFCAFHLWKAQYEARRLMDTYGRKGYSAEVLARIEAS